MVLVNGRPSISSNFRIRLMKNTKRVYEIKVGDIIQHPKFKWWKEVTRLAPMSNPNSESGRTYVLWVRTNINCDSYGFCFYPNEILNIRNNKIMEIKCKVIGSHNSELLIENNNIIQDNLDILLVINYDDYDYLEVIVNKQELINALNILNTQ